MDKPLDILPLVSLSQLAVNAYCQFARSVAATLVENLALDGSNVPDEKGVEQDDGSLLIYVDISPEIRMEFTVPTGEWQWKGMN